MEPQGFQKILINSVLFINLYMKKLIPVKVFIGLFLFLLTTLAPSSSQGQALDPTFLNTGTGAIGGGPGVKAIAIQSDGKVLIGGSFTTYNGVSCNLARVNPDGSLDATFGGSGGVNAGGGADVNAIAIQSDGNILVGLINTVPPMGLVRLLGSNGATDVSFSTNIPNSAVNAIVVQSNGQILIGGAFSTCNGIARNGLARLNSDGTLDATFIGSGFASGGSVNAIAMDASNNIYVGGTFTIFNGVSARELVSLTNSSGNTNGAFSASFSNGSSVNAIAVDQLNGKLVVGGSFTSPGTNLTRLIMSTGAVDGTFTSPNPNAAVNTIALQADGKILIGGAFTNSTPASNFARVLQSGSFDTGFNTTLPSTCNSTVNALAMQLNGRILAGGSFTSYNAVSRGAICRVFQGTLTTSYSISPVCAGASINVSRTCSNATLTGANQFCIELSDAAGSFAAPTVLGCTLTTSPGGGFPVTIPPATPAGSGYRVRVTSSDPSIIGTDNGINITINAAPPAPTFTGATSICTGTATTLTASGTGSTYAWYIAATGGSLLGSAAAFTTPNLSANTTYYAENSNGGCPSPRTPVPIIVSPAAPATPGVITGSASVCAGSPGNVYSITGVANATTYNWGVPAGATITAGAGTTSITVTFGAGGGNVTVNAQNGCGTSTNATTAVGINTAPSISLQPTNVTSCAGSNASFSVSATGTTLTYQWQEKVGAGLFTNITNGGAYSGATSNILTLTGVFAGMSTNQYQVIVSGACIPSVTSNGAVLTVNPTPILAPGSNSPVCATGTINLSVTGATSYSWTGPNAYASIVQNPTIAGATSVMAGTYNVTGTSAGCSSTPTLVNVIVNPNPIANAGSNASICLSSSTPLSGSSSAGTPPYSYSWTPGTGLSSTTIANPTASPTTTTPYSLQVTDIRGCLSSASSVTITVNPTVTPTISISQTAGGNPICTGSSATFTATITNGGAAPTYQWLVNGTLAGTNANTFSISTLSNGDNVICSLTSNASCPSPNTVTSNSIAMAVDVFPISSVTINGQNTVCSGETGVNYGVVPNPDASNFTWTVPTGASFTFGGFQSSINVTYGSSGGNITVTPYNSCGNGPVSSFIVTMAPPSVNAGSDTTICSGNTYQLNGSGSGPISSVLWTRSGTGTFDNDTIPNPVYTPTTADNSSGSVTITLSGTSPCGNVSDNMILTIKPFASVSLTSSAGSDNQTICSGNPVSTITYSISGTGTSSTATGLPPGVTGTYSAGIFTIAGTPATIGTYSYTVSSVGACMPTSATGTIVVTGVAGAAIPDANFVTWLTANYPGCMCGNMMDTTCAAITSATFLSLGSQSISNLTGIEYFTSLQGLNCSNNSLTSIPNLPVSLTQLYCGGNPLFSLPSLPPSLIALDCQTNSLSSLPSLPASLQTINCGNNSLISLPALPASLTDLSCYNNTLTSLPSLPAGLLNLVCVTNSLTVLPTLPASLANLGCGFNSLGTLPTLPNSLCTLTAAGNPAGLCYPNTPTCGTFTADISLCALGSPNITSISPGTACIGDVVTLTGSAFTGVTAVTINAINAPVFSFVSDSQIDVTVPVGASTGIINVTTGTGSGNSPSSLTVNQIPATPGAITGPTTVCSGQTGVTYSISAVPFATSYIWGVPGGSSIGTGQGTTSLTANFGASPGNISVIASNACGGSAADNQAISINFIPSNPGAISGPSSVCTGQTGVVYSISAVSAATGYTWNLPPGSSITSGSGTTSITVTFGVTPGSISVTADNACGSSGSSTLAMTISPLPSAANAGVDQSLCTTATTFGATTPTTGFGTWSLVSGSGTILNGPDPNSPLNTLGSGTNTFRWTVSSGTCPTSTDDVNIIVNSIPAAPGPITGPSSVCANQAGVVYSVTPVSGATGYTWNLPPGASITSGSGTASITVTFAISPGSVSVSADNSCGSSPLSNLAITNNSIPATPGVITGPVTYCAGGTGIYSISPVTAAASYTWTLVGGGTITSGQGTTSINTSFGTSPTQVCVTADNSCGSSASSCQAISASTTPGNPASITGPSSVCTSQTGINYSCPAVAGATSYIWTIPPGATITSGGTTNAITVDFGTTSGNICVAAANSCGTSSNNCVAIAVNPIPTGTLSGGAPICAGNSDNLTVIFTGGAGPWDFDYFDGASTTTITGVGTPYTLVVSPASNTTYTITSVIEGSCAGTFSGSATTTVIPAPTATISGGTTICASGSDNLTVTFTGSGGPWNFDYFDGASTITITGAGSPYSLIVSPASTTTYTITSVTEGACAGTFSGSATTTVTPASTATISGGTSICSSGTDNLTVTFTGSGGPWNFDYFDGSATTTITGVGTPYTLTVSPASTTTYTITSVTEGACAGTFSGSATTTVNPPPTATLSGGTAICPGGTDNLTVTFTGGAGPWDFTYTGGATPVTITGATSPYTLPVSPAVTTNYNLTAVSEGSCTGTFSGTATTTVNAPPAAPTAGSNSSVCISSPINLTANFITGATYSWTGPNSFTSSLQNPAIASSTAADAGTFSVTATVSGCTSAAGTVSVVIDAAPTANAGPDQTICSGTNPPISGSVAGSATGGVWSSTGTGSFTASSTTLNNTYNPSSTEIAAGSATLTLTTSGGACASVSDQMIITINAGPNSALAVSPAKDTLCVGINGTVTVSSSEVGVTYTPMLGASVIGGSLAGTGGSIILTVNVSSLFPGVNTVTVNANNGSCAAVTLAANSMVTFDSSSTAATASNSNQLCNGTAIVVSVPSGNNGYQWFLGSSTIIGATSNTYSVVAPGNYSAKIINSFGCSVASNGKNITTIAPPVIIPSGGAGNDTLLTVSASGATSFQWYAYAGQRAIMTANSSSYRPYFLSDYAAEANINGCRILSNNYTLNNAGMSMLIRQNFMMTDSTIFIPSINSVSQHKADVFPNPSFGNFTVSYQCHSSKEVSMKVINSAGITVAEKIFGSHSGIITAGFDEFHFSPGIYLVYILEDGKQSVKSLTVF
jgi:large repetitive protein